MIYTFKQSAIEKKCKPHAAECNVEIRDGRKTRFFLLRARLPAGMTWKCQGIHPGRQCASCKIHVMGKLWWCHFKWIWDAIVPFSVCVVWPAAGSCARLAHVSLYLYWLMSTVYLLPIPKCGWESVKLWLDDSQSERCWLLPLARPRFLSHRYVSSSISSSLSLMDWSVCLLERPTAGDSMPSPLLLRLLPVRSLMAGSSSSTTVCVPASTSAELRRSEDEREQAEEDAEEGGRESRCVFSEMFSNRRRWDSLLFIIVWWTLDPPTLHDRLCSDCEWERTLTRQERRLQLTSCGVAWLPDIGLSTVTGLPESSSTSRKTADLLVAPDLSPASTVE